MDLAMQMNSKLEITVPFLKKTTARPMQKAYKLRTISCKATDQLSMQEKKTNLYKLLSLGSENVDFDEIKRAYRSMVLQYHPDVCPDPSAKVESTRRFVELRKAYEILSDPVSRKRYDYELGLVDSIGFGAGGFYMDSRRSSFPREIWENQLCGLKKRSNDRMRKKNEQV